MNYRPHLCMNCLHFSMLNGTALRIRNTNFLLSRKLAKYLSSLEEVAFPTLAGKRMAWSSGNSVAYDLILSPKVENARKPHLTPLKGKENKEQLEEKMTAAEMRKKSIDNEKQAKVAVEMERINQVQTKKQLIEEEKSKLVKEKQEQRMYIHIENKEAQIKALLDRLHAKGQHIKEMQIKLQKLSELHAKKLEEKIQHKEAVIKEKLESQRKAQTERWLAREKHAKEILAALQESIEKQSKSTEENLQQKMAATEENRQALIHGLQERLRSRSQKMEQAKQLVEALVEEAKKTWDEKLRQKLEQFEENRKKELRKIVEKVEAHNHDVETLYQHFKIKRESTEARG
ncbi:golgin subfamily A member 6-like protein 26 isoform X1 [Acropora muricata]|uniref:golgin subfamily A member 6-like protein 26 isoform X1 n=2 Tax=Acropora muricata TaxID=159855 RepID=UPI0034E4240A